MRFLADESCDFSVVRALRNAGYDVHAVSEISPRLDDDTIIDIAADEDRMMLTEDKDFGQLVFAEKRVTAGVLLLRFPATARGAIAQSAVDLVRQQRGHLRGRFIVLQPGRVRISGLPLAKEE